MLIVKECCWRGKKERWMCVIANFSSKKKQFTLNKFQLISTGIHIATFIVMIYISICFIFNYQKKKLPQRKNCHVLRNNWYFWQNFWFSPGMQIIFRKDIFLIYQNYVLCLHSMATEIAVNSSNIKCVLAYSKAETLLCQQKSM